MYHSHPFPRVPCLRLAGIFMSALLAFLHPHTTYLAGFIFVAIWWEFVEKLKNSNWNHNHCLFMEAMMVSQACWSNALMRK